MTLVSMLYFGVLDETPFFSAPRYYLIDTLFQLRAEKKPPKKHLDQVVIVGIDDESYQKINRSWPWGREIFAVFLERLESFKPKITGFDISFVGRSDNDGVDRWLAEGLAKNGNVVLSSYFSPTGSHMAPLELFEQSAKAVGFIDKTISTDSSARLTRVLIPVGPGDEAVYSFAAETSLGYLGLEPSSYVRQNKRHLFWENAPLQTDAEGHFWLSYRYRQQDFKYIPFWKIIAKKVSADEIQGRIALVGVVSDVSHDVHDTPLGRMPGIFINANDVVALLDKDFIVEAFPRFYPLLVWVLALVAVVIFQYSNFGTKILLLLSLETALFAAAAWAFTGWNILPEPFSPMLMVLLAFVSVLSQEGLRTYVENAALQKLVIMDSLTGLYGYSYLSAKLERDLLRADPEDEFCYVMIDIDKFKHVNDDYGHEQGNAVLIKVAGISKSLARSKDIVARYGGDELSMILYTNAADAEECLKRIRVAVENTVLPTPKGDLKITVSAGICSNKNPKVKSKDDLIRLADEALYQAKASGRNRVYVNGAANTA
jgi:diguanylate cyclase (GGDEF)-like protein